MRAKPEFEDGASLRRPFDVMVSRRVWFDIRNASATPSMRTCAWPNSSINSRSAAGRIRRAAGQDRCDFRRVRLHGQHLANAAEQKGLQLIVMPSRARVVSDPAMLRAIVGNLVGNAIKYTGSGRVLVTRSRSNPISRAAHTSQSGCRWRRCRRNYNCDLTPARCPPALRFP
jgi:hypothetical protein